MKHRNPFMYAPLWLAATLMAVALMPAVAGRTMPDRRPQRKAQATQATQRTAPDTDSLAREDSRRYQYFFLEAVNLLNDDNDAAATDLLLHCLEINPKAPEPYFLLADQYIGMDSIGRALSLYERAAALSPGNDVYQERVAAYSVRTDFKRAVAAFEQLYSHHPDRTDVLSVLSALYSSKKDYRQALRCVERIEEVDGTSEELTLSKMQLYEAKGDKKMAYQTLKQLADQHPSDVNYRLMLGNWLMQNDRKDEAFRLFRQALADEPENEHALSSMYDYYHDAGNDSLAERLRDRILLSPKTSADTKGTLMRQVIKDNEATGADSTRVIALFNRVLDADPKLTDLGLLKAAYMDLKHMPDEQIDTVLMKVLEVEPDNRVARVQLIQSLWKRQRWNDIIAQSQQAIQYAPDELLPYYFLGTAAYQNDDTRQALEALRHGTQCQGSASDPEVTSEMYALMGDILHQKGKADEAYAAYDSCLQLKSDNYMCLNNYAYFLSEDNRDLKKAEGMSYRTVKAEPNNATFLDTYAWILFMQKRYDDAKVYIDQALATDTDTTQSSATIIEHAGDIYCMTGHTDEAVRFWQKAIDRGADNEALLRKKIRLRKVVTK